MAYNLYKFQIDNTKIEAWATHETEEVLRKKNHADLNFLAIDLKFLPAVGSFKA